MGKTTIPGDFKLTDEMRMWAKYKTPTVNVETQFEMFCDYWKAHGKKMLDWQATWRNWMRRAPEFERPVDRYSRMTSRPTPVSAPPTPEAEEAYRRRMEAANRDVEAKYGRRQ